MPTAVTQAVRNADGRSSRTLALGSTEPVPARRIRKPFTPGRGDGDACALPKLQDIDSLLIFLSLQ